MSYAYGYGTTAASQCAYFSTAASVKVVSPSSPAATVSGPRRRCARRAGRNTMRYFLAIDAHLRSASAPAHAQLERRLLDWARRPSATRRSCEPNRAICA
jgi:hypothetical protein